MGCAYGGDIVVSANVGGGNFTGGLNMGLWNSGGTVTCFLATSVKAAPPVPATS